MDKKEELMQMRDTLSSVQKTLSEKETVLQEINACLAEQILKTSSESEMLGGISSLEKVSLIIYILWYVFSRLYSSYNEEKNILNYKIPLNRNQGYAFPIQYTEELKDRTTLYETLPYGYR
ncbi:hypothetical protein GLOIN_2v1830120 [Rhizophagus irregularis DAOM 181602=DAOM 197198]|nr:hypothetical protein GLOIN_2v1830120 [Rhizophagus irregularis DAOM 181602=DAOM 197198]